MSCGILLIAVGVTLAGWWPLTAPLEAAGARLWRRIAPLSRRLLSADPSLAPAFRIWRHYLIGMVWGWLPCGLVYGALTTAATTGGAVHGAMFMLAFGVCTMPVLLATGAASQGLKRLTSHLGMRWTAGAFVVAFGLWTLIPAIR